MPEAEKPNPHGESGSLGGIKLFGVPVRLHFTFVLLLVFLLFIGVGDRQSGPMTVLYILALFASVLLHEVGHALVARKYGIRTLEIVMYPIGGVSRPERQPAAREELWIALAGPMVNLLLAVALLAWVAAHQGFQAIRERLALGNLLLCVFNLLPAYPMDGGRILRSFLALHRSEEEATRIAAGAGQSLAFLMGLAGLLYGNYMLVFVALFVYLGAFQEGAAARSRILTAGYTVGAAMITDFRTLEHGATIRDAGDLLLKTSQHDFPVMHGGQVSGLLTRSALVRAMMTAGPESYVAGVMEREFVRLTPDMPLASALPQLSAAGGAALVMDAEDHLAGILTGEHLSEFILLRQATVRQASGPA
jgi:Zn-dependent protease/CBS domain-containing protein